MSRTNTILLAIFLFLLMISASGFTNNTIGHGNETTIHKYGTGLNHTTSIPITVVDEDEDKFLHRSNSTVAYIPRYPLPKYDKEADSNLLWFPRIIGGSLARLGEFPAKVSIQTRRGSYLCGGSLISVDHVLTAAHCLEDSNQRFLPNSFFRLMADDLSITVTGSPQRQIRFPSLIFIHADYDPIVMANDIGVIRTDSRFIITPTLNYMLTSLHSPAVGQNCRLAGWGTTVEGGPASPALLRVDLNVISTSKCNSSSSYNGLMPTGTFCAGSMAGGIDSCQGDSGGALICQDRIQGVVSFGFGCARPNFPGVYVDVSIYFGWIQSTLTGNHTTVPLPRHGGGSSVHGFTWHLVCAVLVWIFISSQAY